MDWHWELCPRCGASGRVSVQVWLLGGTALTDRTALMVEERPCAACDGLGRVKVPYGFHLQPDPVVTYTTGNTATAPTDCRWPG